MLKDRLKDKENRKYIFLGEQVDTTSLKEKKKMAARCTPCIDIGR